MHNMFGSQRNHTSSSVHHSNKHSRKEHDTRYNRNFTPKEQMVPINQVSRKMYKDYFYYTSVIAIPEGFYLTGIEDIYITLDAMDLNIKTFIPEKRKHCVPSKNKEKRETVSVLYGNLEIYVAMKQYKPVWDVSGNELYTETAVCTEDMVLMEKVIGTGYAPGTTDVPYRMYAKLIKQAVVLQDGTIIHQSQDDEDMQTALKNYTKKKFVLLTYKISVKKAEDVGHGRNKG